MENFGSNSAAMLRSIVNQIEALEEEKRELSEYVKDSYAEAKSKGFDPKIVRQVVRRRKMERAEREEQETLVQTYLAALDDSQ